MAFRIDYPTRIHRAPNTLDQNVLKLGLKGTLMLGATAAAAFFGIGKGGAEMVGAKVGEPIYSGTGDAAAIAGDVIAGAAGEVKSFLSSDDSSQHSTPSLSQLHHKVTLQEHDNEVKRAHASGDLPSVTP